MKLYNIIYKNLEKELIEATNMQEAENYANSKSDSYSITYLSEVNN